MANKYTILIVTVSVITVLDQLTKAYVAATMGLHDSYVVIQGLLNITYVRNPGAAFGFLANAPAVFRSGFFIFVTAAAMVLIVYYIVNSTGGERRLVFAMSLIMGGAFGNLIDRVRFNEVVDFIDVHIGGYHWPAFNVADSAVSVGALLLILTMVRREKNN